MIKTITKLIAILSISLSPLVYSTEAGQQAPKVALPLLENGVPGKLSTLEDYRGKLVYLDFWASWCGPCRQSLPILNDIRAQFANDDFEVLAINVDEKLSDALKFLKKYPVDYPVLLDPKGQSPRAYGVPGMPTAYLIDEQGIVIYKHSGFHKKDKILIEKLIIRHIKNR